VRSCRATVIGQEAAASYTYKRTKQVVLPTQGRNKKEHAKGVKRINRLGEMQKHRGGQKITDFTERGKKEKSENNNSSDMFLRSIDSREEAKWYKCVGSSALVECFRKG